MQETLEEYFAKRREWVNQELKNLLPENLDWPSHLHRAMMYSLFPGGKRLRPILVIAAYEAIASDRNWENVMPVALSVELMHVYSLIHDDLPQMDDDDLRYGLPTNHRVYGETLAILAGDALQAKAFQTVSDQKLYPQHISPSVILQITRELAYSASEDGIVGGQSMDLGYEGDIKGMEHLAFLFSKKTGILIKTSIIAGALIAGASSWQIKTLSTFGERLGLAFQITDDLLDDINISSQSNNSYGKHSAKKSSPSIVEFLGAKGSREWGERAITEALQAIDSLDERAEPLRAICRWIPHRLI